MDSSRAAPELDIGACRRLVRLAARAASGANGTASIDAPGAVWLHDAPELPSTLRALLGRLPLDSTAFCSAVRAQGDAAIAVVRALAAEGSIEEAIVTAEGEALARVRRPCLPPPLGPIAAQRDCALAAGTYLRWGDAECLLLAPSSRSVVCIATQHLSAVAAAVSDAGDAALRSVLLDLLFDNGMLAGRDAAPPSNWAFPDLLFHSVATHGGGGEGGYGATWAGLQARGTAPRAPACAQPAIGGQSIALTPAPQALGVDLGAVLAARRSCRSYADRALSPQDLAPLLQHALRTQCAGVSRDGLRVAFHPYPSGGACDEITTLVALRGETADGSTARLAVYRNDEHRLQLLADSADSEGSAATAAAALRVLRILAAAGEASRLPGAALVFAADYERMALKYEAIAYATILRNVGAIYQSVSLVAHALGLGSCAVGGGWGAIERAVVAPLLRGRVVVGGMLVGWPSTGIR